MATPHIKAEIGDFGKTVLMPGDPLRSKYVAETYLENPVLVNNVRGVQGYTGTYKGVKVSVMASGMGMPSMSIYSHELFNFFGVDNIMRIGSAGAVSPRLKMRDIVFAQAASTTSNIQDNFGIHGHFAPIADFTMLRNAVEIAEDLKLSFMVGGIVSDDCFYDDDPDYNKPFIKMGALALEMETAALYMQAARAGKRALTLCTISDSLVTGESLDSRDREIGLNDMMIVALETAVKMESIPLEHFAEVKKETL
ncbi:MAG: purine-nucleoside phosphorylase [Clostridia bacterium]|nr:purine-nucleoside phosphorylase [Clostridia bacterium]